MRERFLIDNSALQRWRHHRVAEVLDPLHEDGVLAVASPVEMEVMYSARNDAEARRLHWFLFGFDYLPMPDEVWDRAKDVQRQAVAKGFHRALSMADLLIAATAERHRVVVLHYDQDYDMIAAITGQDARWVVEAGVAEN